MTGKVSLPITQEFYEQNYNTTIAQINPLIKKCSQSSKAALSGLLLASIPTASSFALAHYKKIAVTQLFIIANIFVAAIGVGIALVKWVERQKTAKDIYGSVAYTFLTKSPLELTVTSENSIILDPEYSEEALTKRLDPLQIDAFKKYCFYEGTGLNDEVIDLTSKISLEPGRVSLLSYRPFKLTLTESTARDLDTVREEFRPWRELLIETICSEWVKKIDESALYALGAAAHIHSQPYPGKDSQKSITYSQGRNPTHVWAQFSDANYEEFKTADDFRKFLQKTYRDAT